MNLMIGADYMSIIESLKESLYKGFVDRKHTRTGNYQPRLLVNNYRQNEDILTPLLEELDHCEDFFFSVAFITESGLATLKSHLWDL